MGFALLIIFLCNLAAAINLSYADKYVFYNLAYFVIAYWAAYGAAYLATVFRQARYRPAFAALILASVLLMPPGDLRVASSSVA